MIRESEHFHFAGRKSTDFHIRNISINDGLYEEQIVANKKINEVMIPGRKKPYFFDVTEEPKIIQLSFGFPRGWDDGLIDEVTRWLNVDTYQPLYFEGNIDRVFYAIPVDGIRKIHNGLKEGYLTLNMRCDSGRSYSHKIMTPFYNTQQLAKKQSTTSPIIKINNIGHYSFSPSIWLQKISDGDIKIFNKTNGNKEFSFKNIDIGEKLFIDCQRGFIKSDKNYDVDFFKLTESQIFQLFNEDEVYRYDDFNDNYLKIIYGENILELSNNVIIRFNYEYLFS